VTAPPSRREEARRSWLSYSFRPELKSVAESLREIRGEEGGGGVVRKGREGGSEGGSEGGRNPTLQTEEGEMNSMQEC